MRNGQGSQRNARLLIVDDEDFVREAIELYFSTEGFETLAAASGEEALEKLTQHPVDLAILDIMMPGMDGIQLLREIKKHDSTIEVVMASGCGTLESAIESMRLGAYDYVTKPILNFDEDLLKVVRKALERRHLLDSNRQLSLDLREINRELKDSNVLLKRHVAELEILSETSRLLCELDDAAAVTSLVLETMHHHFQVPGTALFVKDDASWHLRGALGLRNDPQMRVSSESIASATRHELEDILAVDLAGSSELSVLLPKQGNGERPSFLVPMRVVGNIFGYLLVLPTQGWNFPQEQLRLLRLLAAQVATPLALLCKKELTP